MKKVIIAIVALLLVALVVPAAYAAVNADKQKEINALNKQILELRKQTIDKYAESGQINSDQAKVAKDRINQAEKNIDQNNGQFTPGLGRGACGGPGFGGCGGPGACYGYGANGGNTRAAVPNSY